MQVYLITNDVNDKAYVGACLQSTRHRLLTHFSEAERGKGCALQDAIREYGPKKFHITSVWSGNLHGLNKKQIRNKLGELEKYYIRCFQTLAPLGYNISRGGLGNASPSKYKGIPRTFSYRHTEDAKKRIGIASKNQRALDGICPSFLGRHHSEETKAKIRSSKIGSTASQATLDKRAETMKQIRKSAEYRNNLREAMKKWWKDRKNVVA